ncbi:MAG TPA: chorismate mutase [Gemmatimonadales bacterium]
MTSAARTSAPSRAAAVPLRIGIQGEAGSFSESAMRRLPSLEPEPMYFDDFAPALAALEAGTIDRALLPVHNSLAGVVHASLRAIAAHDLRVEAEVDVPVRLALLALPGAGLGTITSAASHPVALRQCSRFFAHHPGIAPAAVHDTAGAARLVAARGDAAAAAIASREAGERYGLVPLATEIQDRADNRTRFWLLARRQLTPGGDVTSQVEAHLSGERHIAAIRGATTVPADTKEEMKAAVTELLAALLERNRLAVDEIVSAVFSVTPDIVSGFPALAAREAGWGAVPMLCTAEVAVPGALARCIRVLVHARMPEPTHAAHAYLRDARALRPDLARD